MGANFKCVLLLNFTLLNNRKSPSLPGSISPDIIAVNPQSIGPIMKVTEPRKNESEMQNVD